MANYPATHFTGFLYRTQISYLFDLPLLSTALLVLRNDTGLARKYCSTTLRFKLMASLASRRPAQTAQRQNSGNSLAFDRVKCHQLLLPPSVESVSISALCNRGIIASS